MTWMADKLNKRIQIRKGVQTPNSNGGYDRSYTTLTTIWAGLNEVSGTFRNFVEVIRGESISAYDTHEFLVRNSAIKKLGQGFEEKGFSDGFDAIEDISSVKSDYFIFLLLVLQLLQP